MVDIDPEHFAQQVVGILSKISVVPARASILEADVQIAVRAKRHHVAVVIRIQLRHHQKDAFLARSLLWR